MLKNKIFSSGFLVLLLAGIFVSGCSKSESYYEKASQALESGNYETAFENYSKSIMEDDNLQMSYRGAGICSFMMADYVKAEEYLVRGLQQSKGVVGEIELDMSYYLAETYVCVGNYDEALDIYTNVLNYDSNQIDALVYRGVLYSKRGDLDAAKKDFDNAVKKADKKDDKLLSIYYNAYKALSEAGYEGADEYLSKGLSSKDDSMEGKYMKGCLYNAANETEKALEILTESQNAGYGKAAFLKGQIYMQQGDLNGALECFNAYVKVSNVSVAEFKEIIQCKILLGDYEGAKSDCEYAVSNASGSQIAVAKFEQIVALEKMGDFEGAKEKMSQYLSEYPDDEKAIRENEFLQTR